MTTAIVGDACTLEQVGGMTPLDADDDALCAICFEEGPFVSLPCACRIDYCSACWDRALATSVSVRGHPQCPSCRTGFHIEYNQEAQRLEFSKEDEAMTRADWRACLYGKTKPLQKKLLKDFGAAVKHASMFAEEVPDEKVPERMVPEECNLYSKQAQDESWSCSKHREGCEPLCLCGAVLERLSGRDRILRLLQDTDPDWRSRVMDPEKCISTLVSSSLVTCDLCDENAMTTGFVWTCSNGPRTVMHPAAYDICESCFTCHSGCSEVSDSDDTSASATSSQSGGSADDTGRRGAPTSDMQKRLKRLMFSRLRRWRVSS